MRIDPRPLLFLSLAACSVEGVIDSSGVGSAPFGEPYVGELTVVDYSGPARWTVVGGALPEGLSLVETGRIEGTPTWLGAATFDVRVSDMERVEDALASVTIAVVGGAGTADAFLGFERDQLNNMADMTSWNRPYGYMSEIWVRPRGGGVSGMDSYTIKPAVFLPGDNGEAEGGLGDDRMIGTLDPSTVEFDLDDFAAVEGWSPDLPDRVQTADGEPVTLSGAEVVAGSDTGKSDLVMTHAEWGTVETEVNVVPPDWCARGYHPDGGYTTGCCLPEDCPDGFLPDGW